MMRIRPKGTNRHTSTAETFRKDILCEIERRSAAGLPLNSGANRGDWLYAGAVRFFGSWGNAVEATGITYSSVKQADLNRDELVTRLRAAAEAGPLVAGEHRLLASNARRLFGTWKKAVKAAGGNVPSKKTWSKERVVEEIEAEVRRGLPVTSVCIMKRNQPLYGAGRREFGTWRKALKAAGQPLPRLVRRRRSIDR
jgi:hypothetical protein